MHADRREGWRWDQENNKGKRDVLAAVEGKEINAHFECANHYNLTQKSGIKDILLTDLFLRFIKIMPAKQFLLLSLDLLQNLCPALGISLFLPSFLK